MPSILRSAHGAAAAGGALLVAERPSLDEIPAPNAALTGQGLALNRERGRPFQPGNAASKNRKPKLARPGLDVQGADPEWARFERQGRRYTRRRVRELATQHGGSLTAGVAAMIASAGLALSSSRYLYTLAGRTADPALFKQAASLADSARQQELTAVALAEREAASRGDETDNALRVAQAEFQRALTSRQT